MSRLSFWQSLKATYGGALAFVLVCPLLAAVPVVFEILQHVVEVRIGMYESPAAMQAVGTSSVRMGFGFIKVLSLTISVYWTVRFLQRRDRAFAARLEHRAVQLFAGFLLFALVGAGVQLFLLPQTTRSELIALVVGQVIDCLVCGWAVAASLGNSAIGPLTSARLMGRRLPWTFAFLLVAMFPLMVVHYLLAAAAILLPKALLWPTLVVDSLVVGYLTPILNGSSYYAALHATTLAGLALEPADVASNDEAALVDG